MDGSVLRIIHRIRRALIAGAAAPIAGATVSVIVGDVALIGLALGVYLLV